MAASFRRIFCWHSCVYNNRLLYLQSLGKLFDLSDDALADLGLDMQERTRLKRIKLMLLKAGDEDEQSEGNTDGDDDDDDDDEADSNDGDGGDPDEDQEEDKNGDRGGDDEDGDSQNKERRKSAVPLQDLTKEEVSSLMTSQSTVSWRAQFLYMLAV
jgi:hypothetical protein